MASAFPFQFHDVEASINQQLLADFHGERTAFIQVGPKKYVMTAKYRDFAADFYNFKLRPDDTFIVTYPRSGTTVMQEMLWLLSHGLDYKAAAKTSLFIRAPFLEFNCLVHDGLLQDVLQLVQGDEEMTKHAYLFASSNVPMLQASSSPRVIKTHLPLSLLPPAMLDTCKVVYMARNPKDMAVSFYHHNRLFTTQHYVGDFPKYWNYFQRDLLLWCPYWEHLAEAWEQRHHPNMLFLFYEDLVKDCAGVIRRVAAHLGKHLDDTQVEKLQQHLHIDNFRNNSSTNLDGEYLPGLRVDGEQHFIRKGKNQGWIPYFTPEMNKEADQWINENLARIPDFKFPEPL